MEQNRVRNALRAVEYRRVAASIDQPGLLLRAHRTPIGRDAALELIRSLSDRAGIGVPTVRWGLRNWASPDRNRLSLRLQGLTLHTVLHEFTHLLTGKHDQVPRVGNRRQWHGPEFVQTLDRLLETTRESCIDSDLCIPTAVKELERTLEQRRKRRQPLRSRLRRWLIGDRSIFLRVRQK